MNKFRVYILWWLLLKRLINKPLTTDILKVLRHLFEHTHVVGNIYIYVKYRSNETKVVAFASTITFKLADTLGQLLATLCNRWELCPNNLPQIWVGPYDASPLLLDKSWKERWIDMPGVRLSTGTFSCAGSWLPTSGLMELNCATGCQPAD